MEVTRKMAIDTEMFEVGDVIKFKLSDGQKVKAMAVRQEQDGMLFITVDCLKDAQPMFKNPGGMGSVQINYLNSDLRHYLKDTVLPMFPEEIKSRMVAMRIGNGSEFDMLRIPTEKENFGENPCGEDEDKSVKRFKGMKKRRNRIAFRQTEDNKEGWEWYWLQNRIPDTAAYFACVSNGGGANSDLASYSFGVRPVFLLS